MTHYNLYLPTQTAVRCKRLLDQVSPHAKRENLECSFLLSVASMLLCQTSDKVHKDIHKPESLELAKTRFGAELEQKLRDLRIGAPAHGILEGTRWACVRDRKLKTSELAQSPEEKLGSEREVTNASLDWTTRSFFKHVRNGIAHGNVWWGPESKSFRGAEHEINLVFIRSVKCGELEKVGVGGVTWQETRFTVDALKEILIYWCELLIEHKIPPAAAAEHLSAAA
jgi:hypothetical protein